MDRQVVIITTEAELEQTLGRFAEKLLEKSKSEKNVSERLTRRAAAKFMGCSYQTMYNYVKQGIIKEHGTPGKRFFLRDELIEVMKNNSK